MLITTLALTALSGGAVLPTSEQPFHAEPGGVQWFEGSYEEVLAAAKSESKPVLIYFWSQGSEMCTKFQEKAFGDARCVEAVGDWILFGANVQHPEGRALTEKFGIQTLPSMVFLRPDGTPDDAIHGYADPKPFLYELKRIKSGEKTLTALRETVAGEFEDLDEKLSVQVELSIKLNDLGAHDEAMAVKASILEADPKGKTKTGASLLMKDIINGMYEENHKRYGDEGGPVDTEALVKFLKKTKHQPVLWSGYESLGWIEYENENRDVARAAFMKMWEQQPEEPDIATVQTGSKFVHLFWEDREELDKKSRKWMLTTAHGLQETAHQWCTLNCVEHSCSDACETECDPKSVVKADCECDSYEDQFLTLIAKAKFVNGQKDEAIALAQKCCEMKPENEEHQAFLTSLTEEG